MSSFKTGSTHKKLQPGTVIVGENGLPVDTIATISGSYQILKNNTTTLAYSAGVVTVNVAVDLTPVRGHKTRYTGRLILQTVDGTFYFIDKPSVNAATRTFNIFNDDKGLSVPASIDLSAGWIIAEAEIINRLATSAAPKIDSIEFRDMQFQLELDGDPVSIQDDEGHKLDINPDGSINIGGVVNVDTDLTNIENKLDTLIGEAQEANLHLQDIDTNGQAANVKLDAVNSNLDSIELKLDASNASLDAIEASTASVDSELTAVNNTLTNIEADTSDIYDAVLDTNTELSEANDHLQAIENALAAPLSIEQPVITAGTSNGLPNGPVFVHVNNVKNQILAASDRDQIITYADFGTKDQRITRIDYVSSTFPGVTARKSLTYVVDSNRYKRTNITWTIV